MSRLSSSCWRRSFIDSFLSNRSSCCFRTFGFVVCICDYFNLIAKQSKNTLPVKTCGCRSIRTWYVFWFGIVFCIFVLAIPSFVLAASPPSLRRRSRFGFLFGFNQCLLVRTAPLTGASPINAVCACQQGYASTFWINNICVFCEHYCIFYCKNRCIYVNDMRIFSIATRYVRCDCIEIRKKLCCADYNGLANAKKLSTMALAFCIQ